MRTKFTSAPFVRGKNSVPWMMTSMLIALTPLVVMAVYYYGLRALVVTLISGVSCYLFDMICMLLVLSLIHIWCPQDKRQEPYKSPYPSKIS